MAPQSNSAPSAGVGQDRPKVLYVMGAGRSGSTILGVALGNCDGVFFAGELDKWLLRSGKPKLPGPERERFWEQVLSLVADAPALFGPRAHGFLERSSALFRRGGRRTRRRLREPYRRLNESLYRAIAATAGATYVVDSSHYPLRARELQSIPGLEVHLLFLVRNPHSVVASLAKKEVAERSFDEPTSNLYLWLTYLLAVPTFLRHPRERRLLVRHEDFLEDPIAVLHGILRHAGAPESTPDLNRLRTGFPLMGNRMIESDVVALTIGPAQPARRSPLTAVMQLPVSLVLSFLGPTPSDALREQPSASAAPVAHG